MVDSSNSGQYLLKWKDPAGATQERALPDGELTVGRSSSCGLVLADPKVSREHARLRVGGRDVLIEDLGARNGILVNGDRVSSADLRIGDEIKVGDVTFQLTTAGQTVAAVDQTQLLATSAEGTVILEAQVRDAEATQILAPVAAPAPAPSQRGLVPDDLLRSPIISEADLIANGVEVKTAEYAALGGGMGSFMFVDTLRNSGVPASEIAVISNEARPYGRYRRLVQNSQIPDRERLRSNSESCPDNIWGFPGYAVREIFRETLRLNLRLAATIAWKIFGEPTIAPTFTPKTGDVWRAMDRESKRIGYDQMLVMGRLRAIRKTKEGRLLAVVSQSDETSRKHMAVSAKIMQMALGYPSLQFLPDLAEFREKYGDRRKVVNAYEDHSHVYEHLRQHGGTVVLRGRGIVASRIIQRLWEERKTNPNILVIHLHRSKLTGGHRWGLSSRGVQDEFEFQPFNWPKSNWTGQSRALLERSSDEERKRLLEIWGGTTTADRPDWKKMVRRGLKEGWYRAEYGVVQEVTPGEQGGVVTRISSGVIRGGFLELHADFVIDCTGLIAAPERAPILADLIQTYQLPKNALGRIWVSNEFEIEAMRHENAHIYACGAIILGGPFATVDSFLGLQYAALRAVRHMRRFHPKKLRKLNGLYSVWKWIKYAVGASP
jgi:pSer/pThr/pTyr-binding forkhead associated (FHA) protein